ncbi:MAG: HlyC/CorC family transporter [Acidobacteria bacterium]|nr:HlyC/CorC family transporter [Acidobacteriota bacterium]MBI3663282.1 HlyC/CorC family transporter [Acidobacteriota bacterium]
MIVLRILGVVLLVGLNAFFVAAEFALVAMRASRVQQLIEQGDARARVVKELLDDLDRVLSGAQVGVTIASLGLGFVGENALAEILQPLFGWLTGAHSALIAHVVALGLAFGLISFLHVVLGELVPKSLSLQRTEQMALLTARPLKWFLHLFRWVIDLLGGASRRFLRVLGVANPQSHTLVHSPEELQILIQQVRERGLLDAGEEKFIQSAIELGQVQVREIMVARPDVHLLPVEAGLDEVLRVFATTQRSRLPVYQGTPDHIRGFVHIKDMLWILLDRERRAEEGVAAPEFHLSRILRDVLIVPETKPASELLIEMRSRCVPLAMVVDEFGSILGLVTLEDILEQLVGEIHDEFDVIERPLTLADGAMVFDAALNVRDLETQYNITLPEDPAYATIGGFVLAQLGFIPRGGESFEFHNHRFSVVEMDRRRVARVKIQRLKSPESTGAAPASDSAPASARCGGSPE